MDKQVGEWLVGDRCQHPFGKWTCELPAGHECDHVPPPWFAEDPDPCPHRMVTIGDDEGIWCAFCGQRVRVKAPTHDDLVYLLRRYAVVGGARARADADARGEIKTNEVDLMLAAADEIERLLRG